MPYIKQYNEAAKPFRWGLRRSDEAKAWLLQGIASSREEQRAYQQTVVQEIRTEIKEQEILWRSKAERVAMDRPLSRVRKGPTNNRTQLDLDKSGSSMHCLRS